MSPDLIEAVRARALDPGRRTDNSEFFVPEIEPPLTDRQLADSAAALGFAPNPDLVDLYRAIGNGGFGPAYGLMGLAGGAVDDQGETAVASYLAFTTPDPERPKFVWPQGLLPISELGCAMYTCLDCTDAAGRLVVWEPNVLDEELNAPEGLFPMSENLSEWLAMWAEGHETWQCVEAAMAARGDHPQ